MKISEMIQEVVAAVGWFLMCALCAVAVMILTGCTPWY